MKFGIFFEVSVPRPCTREFEQRAYADALEQAALADEMGFDQLWAVEHHFLEEYSHCSSPEMFLTACAMRTHQIHLCFGIAVCVPQFSSPIRIAERTATLDILSNGRAELGTGRSATWTELGGLQADPDETKQTWDEYVRVIPKMWTQDSFSYSGRAFSMPERPVLPKPVQSPHPPMWVAVSTPGTELDAAERGLGMLGITFSGIAQMEKRIQEYRSRIQGCDPVGSFVNEQVNSVNFLYCSEDIEHARVRGERLAKTFGYLADLNLSTREVYPTPSYRSRGLHSELRQQATGPADLKGIPEGIAIGDPDRITQTIKQWESAGVNRINFVVSAGDALEQEEILESLRLFGREVMPQFK